MTSFLTSFNCLTLKFVLGKHRNFTEEQQPKTKDWMISTQGGAEWEADLPALASKAPHYQAPSLTAAAFAKAHPGTACLGMSSLHP